MALKCQGGIYLPETESHFTTYGNDLADYQRPQREQAFKYVKNWRMALDIGANVGIFSKHFGSRFQNVIAFEPCSGNFEALLANVPSNVECRKQAVGNEMGWADVHFTPRQCGGAHVCSMDDDERVVTNPNIVVNPENVERVELITIDSLDLEHCDLIKLDVQGCEEIVLRGAMRTIKRCRPVIILEEKPMGGKDGPKDFIKTNRKLLTKYFGMTRRELVGADRVYSFDD